MKAASNKNEKCFSCEGRGFHPTYHGSHDKCLICDGKGVLKSGTSKWYKHREIFVKNLLLKLKTQQKKAFKRKLVQWENENKCPTKDIGVSYEMQCWCQSENSY